MSQMGSFPKDPGENKDIWNRHLATVCGLLGTWAYHFFHPKKWQLQIGWIFLKASAWLLNPQNFTHENFPSTQLISGVGEPENDGLVGRGFFFSRGVFSIPAVNLPGCCPYSVTLFPTTYVKACTNPVTPSHSQASPLTAWPSSPVFNTNCVCILELRWRGCNLWMRWFGWWVGWWVGRCTNYDGSKWSGKNTL